MTGRISIPLAVVLAVAATWWLSPDRRAAGEQDPAPAAAPAKWEYATLAKETPSWIWTTGQDEIRTDNLIDLAVKLRLKPKKGEPLPALSVYTLRVLILSHLGSQGWEFVSLTEHGNDSLYTFKRRVQ